MIKLIATDMDGTLLNEKGELPKEFFTVLDRLCEKGVKFVVGSGRSYYNLYDVFTPSSDKMSYICDNGAYVVEDKDHQRIEIIDKNIVHEIINVCSKIENISVTLCGLKGAYHSPCAKEFTDEMYKYYTKRTIVDDLHVVEDDIFKIAVCDMSGSANNSYKVLGPKFGENFSVVVSGAVWLDVMNKGVNKGVALAKIQEDLNISYEETMIFGDFYNDVEMLKQGKYSFVMENANEDMKQYGNYIAKSNRENGVMKAIEEYVF
ncbi:MAG: Cof-type HAD-IIB family hydrolase [Clostridium sp.]